MSTKLQTKALVNEGQGEQEAGVSQEQWREVVWRQVSELDFGVVQITVHDRRVVQIEKTQKLRLEPGGGAGSRTGGGASGKKG